MPKTSKLLENYRLVFLPTLSQTLTAWAIDRLSLISSRSLYYLFKHRLFYSTIYIVCEKPKRYIIKITTPRSIACHFANPVIIKAKVAIIASNEFGPFQGVSFFIFYSWNGHGKAKLQQVNERGLRRSGRYNYFARHCCYGLAFMAISQNMRNVSIVSSGGCFLQCQNALIRL